MNRVFAPGCALVLYKPEVARRLREYLNARLGPTGEHLTCCRHEPGLGAGTQVVNVCPGCDKRFRTLYEGVTTISLWEILAGDPSFPWPDYDGARMAVLDACPTRDQVRIHDAVRAVLRKMGIVPVEPASTRTKSVCCGDSFFGLVPVDEVKEQMIRRAADMPVDDVAVYCVSCVKAVHIGGKRPRLLADLVFGETTIPGAGDPEEWHRRLDVYIEAH